jgi:hypothetical protein
LQQSIEEKRNRVSLRQNGTERPAEKVAKVHLGSDIGDNLLSLIVLSLEMGGRPVAGGLAGNSGYLQRFSGEQKAGCSEFTRLGGAVQIMIPPA